ncbi:[F-actin]-monooxygenase mical3 [Irineochytrium annulatum]|nr:[F-actin]-monooxygenase mical3 [Irineochytrium annulatum]
MPTTNDSQDPDAAALKSSLAAFMQADDLQDIILAFEEWRTVSARVAASAPGCDGTAGSGTTETTPLDRYRMMRDANRPRTHHMADFFRKMDEKLGGNADESGNAAAERSSDLRVLVIGAGPAGLLTAIRTAFLLPSSVLVIEKRDSFSRYNVMRVHQSDMDELKSLGARDFHRALGVGSYESVPIRRVQVILLKMCLVLGVDVMPCTEFVRLNESDSRSRCWTAALRLNHTHELSDGESTVAVADESVPESISPPFNAVINAAGPTNALPDPLSFPRTESRQVTCIGVTANFEATPSTATAATSSARPSRARRSTNGSSSDRPPLTEGGFVAYAMPTLFKSLKEDRGIDLENLCNYAGDKGDAYIVMTPRKAALLRSGVLLSDDEDPRRLVRSSNVDHAKLVEMALGVARAVGLDVGEPGEEEGASTRLRRRRRERDGECIEDVAIFDFSSRGVVSEPCRVVEDVFDGEGTGGVKHLYVSIVGDGMINPFWPLGTGFACCVASSGWVVEALEELGPECRLWAGKVEGVAANHVAKFMQGRKSFAT